MEKNLFLKNCLLIDGKSEKPLEKAGILIKGQKIAEVGRTSSIDVTRRDRPTEINLAGKTVIPGMVDAHFHAMYSCFTTMLDMELKDSLELATLKAAQNLQTKLESGFTTVRDVGCRGNMAVALRDAVDSGLVFGPRIVASSQIISSTGGLTDWLPSWTTWKDSREGLGVSVDGVDEITRVVRGQIRDGVDNVKLGASGTGFNPFCPPRRPTLTYNEMVAAIDLAHKSQKTVAVHAEATEAVKNGVKAGANTIEHGMFLDNECIRLLKQSGTVLIPTLANYTLYAEKGAQAGVMPSVIEEHKKNQREHRLSVKLAHEAKVKIALGTDSGGTFFP
ncbi:MAG: amidohydrolase family protein, partial [Candidatus Bathyarchaeia archaeon]